MSPIESTTSTPDWNSLQGAILEGGYELREILEAEEGSASFRVRVLGDYSQRAFASFYRADGDDEGDQVAVWETLRDLRNENLSGPLAAGLTTVTDVRVEYVVLPTPDETLAAALRERALTEDEAHEVMASIVRALQQLHANGLVHGRVSPEEVVSAGTAIQLATAGVRRINSLPSVDFSPGKYLAPESVEQNTTAAADVWCLGATLLEALRRTAYAPNTDLAAMQLPAGFHRVIEQCLAADPHERCSLADIPELYRQAPPSPIKPAATSPIATPVNGSGASKTVTLAAAAAAGQNALTPAPPMESVALPAVETGTVPHSGTMYDGPILVQSRPADAARPDRTEREPSSKAWLYGVIGVLVLFAIFLFARGRNLLKQPAATASAPVAKSAAPAKNDWTTRTLSPDTSTAKRSGTAATPSSGAATNSAHVRTAGALHGSIWRLVLYTYARQPDAQKKAQSLNEKHTGLGAEVFSPNGNAGPYLVVAGGKMTRDQAVRMRNSALRMGMPHDSYIQNYNQ